jgi:hypothetical protein
MARTKATVIPNDASEIDEEMEAVNLAAGTEDWEWETVHDESPTLVTFDTIGDEFIGQKKGTKFIEQPPGPKGEDNSFTIFLFRGTNGELYGIYESYAMTEGMKKVPDDAWVRIKFVSEVDVKQGNPMKNLRFDVKK